AVERRAFGFDEEVIGLESFRGWCQGHGHQRGRGAFFALRAGRPVAAAVVETGDEGANVFGLLNMARYFPLEDQTPDSAVEEALARAAVAHFRAAGKRTFLWLADEEIPPSGAPERLGLSAAPPGMRWVAHRDAIPAWSSYLQALLRGGTDAAHRAPAPEPAPALDKQGYLDLRAKLDFRPSLLPTLGIALLDVVLVAAATALLRGGGATAFLLSQVLLAIVFFNAFSILHECGHGSASRWPLVNTLLGHLVSPFCFIPYFPWKLIHQQHHLWTGNLDRDPSLRSLRRFRAQGVPALVRWSWRGWIPTAAALQHLVFL